MMNKYTHHLSVAFVVSLEKFPIISHKNSSPEIRFTNRIGGRGEMLRLKYSYSSLLILLMLSYSIHICCKPITIPSDIIFLCGYIINLYIYFFLFADIFFFTAICHPFVGG